MTKRTVTAWRAREVMRERGYSTRDIIDELPEHGIHLSQSQVYREIAGTTKTMSLPFATAFCAIVGCEMNDLVTVATIEALPPAPLVEPAADSPTPDLPRIGPPPRPTPGPVYPPLRPLK